VMVGVMTIELARSIVSMPHISDKALVEKATFFIAGYDSKRVGRPGNRKDFWSRIDRSGGPESCWLWTGNIGSKKSPYGIFEIKGKKKRAHRWVLETYLGYQLPPNIFACHRCDNPRCCNPAHLFPGTPADNVRDCIQKGRFPNPPRKLATINLKRKEIAVARTHCSLGHELAEENVFRPKNRPSTRLCRKCQAEYTTRRWNEKKEVLREYRRQWRLRRKLAGLPKI
jgi:hypothetical protein